MRKLYFSLVLTALCLGGIQSSQAGKSTPKEDEKNSNNANVWVPSAPIKKSNHKYLNYWKRKARNHPEEYSVSPCNVRGFNLWKKRLPDTEK